MMQRQCSAAASHAGGGPCQAWACARQQTDSGCSTAAAVGRTRAACAAAPLTGGRRHCRHCAAGQPRGARPLRGWCAQPWHAYLLFCRVRGALVSATPSRTLCAGAAVAARSTSRRAPAAPAATPPPRSASVSGRRRVRLAGRGRAERSAAWQPPPACRPKQRSQQRRRLWQLFSKLAAIMGTFRGAHPKIGSWCSAKPWRWRSRLRIAVAGVHDRCASPDCSRVPVCRAADNWSVKAIRRKTTGTGRTKHLRSVQRRFKNGFREGERGLLQPSCRAVSGWRGHQPRAPLKQPLESANAEFPAAGCNKQRIASEAAMCGACSSWPAASTRNSAGLACQGRPSPVTWQSADRILAADNSKLEADPAECCCASAPCNCLPTALRFCAPPCRHRRQEGVRVMR